MTLNVTLSDEMSMSDEIPDVIVCHVRNDRMSAHEKNLITPRDRTHRIALESYSRNSQSAGFQARR